MNQLIIREAESIREPRTANLEVNLLKNPFFVLAKQHLKELLQKTIETRKSQVGYKDELSGEAWWVNPSAILGYAGPFDKKVFITVQQLIFEHGLPLKSPLVPMGSLRSLCKRMKLSESGKNKKLVKEALLRIAGAEIYTENTYYLKEGQRFWRSSSNVGGYFHIWDVFWQGDHLPDGRTAECIYLLLNTPFILSLNAFYLKPIDYDYYVSLKSPLAQRLYELFGLRFYGLKDSPYARYLYSKLCTLLPMAKQAYISLAKQQLQDAHTKLLDTGFLDEIEWQDTAGKGDWSILYYPGPRAQEEIARAREQTALPLLGREENLFRDEKDAFMVEALVRDILAVTEDEHSRGFYTQLARLALAKPRLQDLIYRCLSEVKDEWLRGLIRTTKGAVFTDKIKRYCQERKIELGLKAR